jgi:hypothetical protein
MKCGSNFRKPVSQISDRAKRYRAHSAGMQAEWPEGLREVRLAAIHRHRAQRWRRVELAQIEPAI